jgi:hypothetical protein
MHTDRLELQVDLIDNLMNALLDRLGGSPMRQIS